MNVGRVGLNTWCREHKTELVLAAIVIAGITTIVIGILARFSEISSLKSIGRVGGNKLIGIGSIILISPGLVKFGAWLNAVQEKERQRKFIAEGCNPIFLKHVISHHRATKIDGDGNIMVRETIVKKNLATTRAHINGENSERHFVDGAEVAGFFSIAEFERFPPYAAAILRGVQADLRIENLSEHLNQLYREETSKIPKLIIPFENQFPSLFFENQLKCLLIEDILSLSLKTANLMVDAGDVDVLYFRLELLQSQTLPNKSWLDFTAETMTLGEFREISGGELVKSPIELNMKIFTCLTALQREQLLAHRETWDSIFTEEELIGFCSPPEYTPIPS